MVDLHRGAGATTRPAGPSPAARLGVGTRLAFEFLVVTAAWSSEVRVITWDEIDSAALIVNLSQLDRRVGP